MYLYGSNISCGIRELTDVGYNPTQAQYDAVMYAPHCAMVLASLTLQQNKGLKLLKKNGFKRVGRPKRNPNSGNDIVLLVKRIARTRTDRRW